MKNDLDDNTSIANLHKTRSGSSPKSLNFEYVWERSPDITGSEYAYFLEISSGGTPAGFYPSSVNYGVCPALSM